MTLAAMQVRVNQAQLDIFKAQFITREDREEFRAILLEATAHVEPDGIVDDTTKLSALERRLFKLCKDRQSFYSLNIATIVSILNLNGASTPYAQNSTFDQIISSILENVENSLPDERGSYSVEMEKVDSALAGLKLPENTYSGERLERMKANFKQLIDDKQADAVQPTTKYIIHGKLVNSSPILSSKSKIYGTTTVSFGPVLLPSIILGAVALVSLVVAVVTGIKSHLEQVKVDEAVKQGQNIII